MHVSGYTTDELDTFSRVLDAALTEAATRDVYVPAALLAKRLFEAARCGERDPAALRSAMLADHGGRLFS